MDASGLDQILASSVYFMALVVQIILTERKIIAEIRKLSIPDKKETNDVAD